MEDRQNTNQQQTTQMSPEERELLRQQIANNNFMMPYAQKNYAALADNIFAILSGNEPAAKGIGGINAGQTQEMVNAALRDVSPNFQSAGILDSGAALQSQVRAASDVRNQNAQFNVSAAQNLFNIASGGQSNLQGQYQGSTNSLVGQLAGLRSVNTNQNWSGMNPFLKSFQQSLGQSLGSGKFGSMSFGSMPFPPPCWVAAEVFDGWNDIRTIHTRFYIMFLSPDWFRNLYVKYGKKVATFIKNKPFLKRIIKGVFNKFVMYAKNTLNKISIEK